MKPMVSSPAKMELLLILAKTFGKRKINFFRSALFYMKTRLNILKYFVNDCSTRTYERFLFRLFRFVVFRRRDVRGTNKQSQRNENFIQVYNI